MLCCTFCTSYFYFTSTASQCISSSSNDRYQSEALQDDKMIDEDETKRHAQPRAIGNTLSGVDTCSRHTTPHPALPYLTCGADACTRQTPSAEATARAQCASLTDLKVDRTSLKLRQTSGGDANGYHSAYPMEE